MSLLKKFLEKVNLIQDIVDDSPGSDSPTVVTIESTGVRAIPMTLDQMRDESRKIRPDAFELSVCRGEELELTFEDIFLKANLLVPGHGWTLPRVLDRLETLRKQYIAAEEIKAALVKELKARDVATKEILQDAVSRDDLLDEYERFLSARITSSRESLEREIEEIEGQMADLHARRERCRVQMDNQKIGLEKWKKKKVEYEKKMAHAVSFLTIETMVTVGTVTGEENRS
jgi:hypothetical protein